VSSRSYAPNPILLTSGGCTLSRPSHGRLIKAITTIAAATIDPISASLIPRSNNVLRVSLIIFLIELRALVAVVLTVFLIFSTLAAIFFSTSAAKLFGICCKRVALTDGFVTLIADVAFCMGLVNEDNKFEVEVGICCKRVALMDGFVTLIADVAFCMGLVNEDNKFEVVFAAKLLSVDGMK
jgi:hypothetical protein